MAPSGTWSCTALPAAINAASPISRGAMMVEFEPMNMDKLPDDTVDTEDPVIMQIAERLGVHPAVVCVKWAVQRGQVPIPFSTRRSNYLANLQAVIEDPLSADEMRAIAAIDRNSRLIKGQVFLWKDGQPWEDLWDPDGRVTPA